MKIKNIGLVFLLLILCQTVVSAHDISTNIKSFDTVSDDEIFCEAEFINNSSGSDSVYIGIRVTDENGRCVSVAGYQCILKAGQRRTGKSRLPGGTGYTVKAVVRDSINIFSTEETADIYYVKLNEKINECEGIPTDYENASKWIIRRFGQYIDEDLAGGKEDRAVYNAEAVKSIYKNSEDRIDEYKSGERKAFSVPRFIAGTAHIDGDRFTADMYNNGLTQNMPIFFTGYGHFEQARDDIDSFPVIGADIIQMEAGPARCVRATSGIKDWVDGGKNNDVDSTFSVTTEERKGGTRALKITNNTATASNTYQSFYQYIYVKPNTEYEFGFSIKGTNVAANAGWISANGYDFVNRKSINNGTYNWVNKEYAFTTGKDQIITQFVITTEGITEALYIDDIYFREKGSSENMIKNSGFEEDEAGEEFDFCETEILGQINALKKAEDNNVAVSFLLSPHYFWNFIEMYPEIKSDNGGNLGFILTHPKVEKIMNFYIDSICSVLSRFKCVNDICVANEEWYFSCNEPWYRNDYRTYISDLYSGSIDKLNEVYKTSYNSFDEVNPPTGTETTPAFYDYKNFNDNLMYDFLKMLTKRVKMNMPDIPVHTKTMNYMNFQDEGDTRWLLLTGGNHEKLAELFDINGNDAGNHIETKDGSDMDQKALKQSMWYDYLRSVKKMPVLNTEDHIIRDGDTNYSGVHAKHIEPHVWQGAVHGRAGSIIWVWDRDEKKSYIDGNILFRADCVQTVSQTSMDLKRLSNEVYAIADKTPQIGILYSQTARIYSEEMLASAYRMYTASLFSGVKPTFILEGKLDEMNKYPVLLVPVSTNVPKSVVDAVKTYLDNGGKVIIMGEDTFKYDEHNVSQLPEDVSSILSRSQIIPHTASGYVLTSPTEDEVYECVKQILEKEKLINIEIIDTKTGLPAKRVECLDTEYGGRRIINICNYNWDEDLTVNIYINGEKLEAADELRSGKKTGADIELKSYSPVLIAR